MNPLRAETLDRLSGGSLDLAVVGGGITGARIAFEAARLGWCVALLEAGDFGSGTSSASSKLIHGGFRYLPMGDIALVRESQVERSILMDRVAPNLVRALPFLLPVYEGSSRGTTTVAAGLMLYRALAGRAGRAGFMSPLVARGAVPALRMSGLRMCGVFDEAETIDSRFVLATVKGAARRGALVLNHARVTGLELRHNRGALVAVDAGEDGVLQVRARHVINAAGPWVDHVRALDQPAAPLVRFSKGIHLMLPLDGEWRCGVAMPLRGGRVALGIPWQGMLMLGTTDTPFTGDPADVAVTREDVRTVLNEASLFLSDDLLEPGQVRFATAGLRALPITDCKTADARRGHLIEVSQNGLVSVAGGKLTTHRLIAIDALRRLPYAHIGRLDADDSRLPGTGWNLRVEANRSLDPAVADHLERLYGDEAGRVLDLGSVLPDGLERIHPSGPDVWAQVDYAFESEWARTVEDVARRRTTLAMRGLFTDAIRERIEKLAPGRASVINVR